MSEIKISPAPVPSVSNLSPTIRIANAAPPKPALQLQPTAPIVPAPPNTPPAGIEEALAVLILKDGTGAVFGEGELKSLKPGLSPEIYLVEKFRLFHRFILKQRDRLAGQQIKDPALDILFRLNQLIALAGSGALPAENIIKLVAEIEALINSLPASHKDKAALLSLFVKQLFEKKMISKEKAEAILIRLVKTYPGNMGFHENLCQFYVSLGLYKVAAVHYSRTLAVSKVPAEELEKIRDLDGMLKALFRHADKPADAEALQKLGDYLRLWGENENDFQVAKQLLSAAVHCYSRTLFLDQSPELQRVCSLKQAMTYLSFSQLYSKKSEFANPEYSLEYYRMAIRSFEQALRSTMNKLERSDLLVKLGDLYMTQADQEKDEKKVPSLLRAAEKYYLEAKETIPKPLIDLNLRLASLYARMEQYEKAIEEIRSALTVNPEDPTLHTILGDLYFSAGKLKAVVSSTGVEMKGDYSKLTESLKCYRLAFERARKSGNPQLQSLVYRKFLLLRIQAAAELGTKHSGNPLVMLIRMTGDLFKFMNPFNTAAQVLAAALRPPKIPKHTRDELDRFLSEHARLGTEQQLLFINHQTDARYYLLRLRDLIEFKQLLISQFKKADGQIDTSYEKIQSVKELLLTIDSQIEESLKALAYLSGRKSAVAFMPEEPLLKHIVESFGNYLALTEFIDKADLSPALRDTLKPLPDQLWNNLIKELKQTLESAGNKKQLKLAVSLLQILTAAGNSLPGPSGRHAGRMAALGDILGQCYKAVYDIAREKNDFWTLFELAKEPRLGGLAYESLKAALKIAKQAKTVYNLTLVGDLAYAHARAVENQSATLSNLFNELAAEAFKESLAYGKPEQIKASAVALWRLGQYIEAIKAFEGLAARTDKADIRAQIYIDLALMHLAIDKKQLALAYFEKAWAIAKQKKIAPLMAAVQEEINAIRSNKLPPDMLLGRHPFFSSQQLRSVPMLYSRWFGSDPAIAQLALREFTDAQGYRNNITIDPAQDRPNFTFNTKTVIKINVTGNKKTKLKAILRELEFAGLKPGKVFERKKVEQALRETVNRLQAFDDVDWKIEERDNGIIITINVKEPWLGLFAKVGAEGGTLGAFIALEGGIANVWGGGEKLGAKLDYRWFFANGYQPFSMLEGKIFYHDPRLFTWREKPVALTLTAERTGRINYFNAKNEIAMGGSAALSLYLSPRSRITFGPSLYYISYEAGNKYCPIVNPNYHYFKQGNKIEYAIDHRNHFLFPTSGFHFSTSIEPGTYFGYSGGPAAYVAGGVSLRKYFALPGEFSIMLGGKGMLGANLTGGDQFFLGDGFVRGNKDLSKYGPAALGVSAELRSPLLIRSQYFKLQAEVFADFGCVFNSSARAKCGFGVGGGFRFLLFGILPLEIAYGFPNGFYWGVIGNN